VTLVDITKMDAMDAIVDYLIRRVLLDLPLDVGEVGDALSNYFVGMSRHVVTGHAVRVTGTLATHVARTSLLSFCEMLGTCSMMPVPPARAPTPHPTTGIACTHVAPPVPRLRPTGTLKTHVVTGTVTEAMPTGTPQVPVGRRLLKIRALIVSLPMTTECHRPMNRKYRRRTGNNDVAVAEGGLIRRAHVVRVVEGASSSRPPAYAVTRPRSIICTSAGRTPTYQFRRRNWRRY